MKSRKKERRDDDCVVGSEALTKGARLTGLGEPAGNLERPQCILGPLGCWRLYQLPGGPLPCAAAMYMTTP